MTKSFERATEVMRADTGLYANEARGHIGEAGLDLTMRPLLAQHDCAVRLELLRDHGDW